MTTHHTTTSARRRTRLAVGLTAGALLAVAAPLAASAHVEVSPSEAAAGASSELTFSFHHGCDDSPTTALVIDIPEGVGTVSPVVEGGWTISRTLGENGVPTQVTYTADAPIESGLAASVAMEVLFDSDTAGTTLAFPVLQSCVVGETSWSEIPAEGEGEDSVDSPAPAVAVGAAVADDAGADGHGDHEATADASDASATAASDADPVARWLAAGGLVAGLAALAVALVRGRSRKS